MRIIEVKKVIDENEMYRGSFNVAGVTFEGRQETLEKFLAEHCDGYTHNVFFAPEPNNKYDPNAIQVLLEDKNKNVSIVGYVPKSINADFKEVLDKIKIARVNSLGRVNGFGALGVNVYFELSKEQ